MANDGLPWTRLLEGAAKAGTITAVALPALGVAIRWVSYEAGGMPSWLAPAASIPDLAFVGLSGLFPVVAALAVAAVLFPLMLAIPRDSKAAAAIDKATTSTIMVPRWVNWVLIAAPWAVIGFLSPAIIPAFAATVYGGWAVRRWALSGQSSFGMAALSVMASLLLYALTYGLIRTSPDPLYVETSSNGRQSAGWYTPLGEQDAFTWAYSCADGQAVAIPRSSIVRITVGEAQSPASGNLWQVVTGQSGRLWGYRPRCLMAAEPTGGNPAPGLGPTPGGSPASSPGP